MVAVSYWKGTRAKTKNNIVQPGHGLSRGIQADEIPPNASFDMKNLDSRKPFAIKSREPRTDLAAVVSSLTHLGSHKDAVIQYVDGTSWRYLNAGVPTTIATVTAGNAETVDFKQKTLLVNGTDRKFWDGPSGATGDIPAMPVSDFIAVHQNRVYVASKTTERLSFSALSNVNDWTTANDAGSIDVTTKDTLGCTGLVQFANHIMYFKRNSIHELYGTGPFNYQMQVLSDDIGCVANRTILEVMGRLFFLSNDGVYVYVGGVVPKKISFDIQDFIDRIDQANVSQACAGTDGERYYLCLPVDNNARILFTYDTRSGEWFKEDDIILRQMIKINDVLYGGTSQKIKKLVDPDGSEVVNWEHESKEYELGEIVNAKNLHNLGINLSYNGVVQVYVKDERSPYTLIKTLTGNVSDAFITLAIPLSVAHEVKKYQIKFAGSGPVEITQLEHQVRVIPRTF